MCIRILAALSSVLRSSYRKVSTISASGIPSPVSLPRYLFNFIMYTYVGMKVIL